MQEKLIMIRKRKGISQKLMASILNISVKAYSYKELGKTEFSMNEMFKISKFFNLDIDDIFLPTIPQNGVKANSGMDNERC